MRKLVLALAGVATAAIAAPASAAIIPTLQSVTPTTGGFQWLYEGTLAEDQGLMTGDRLIIFDFAGLVAGSLINPYAAAGVTATAELVSNPEGAILPITTGFTDDPNLWNLVFTYTGPNPGPNMTPPFSERDFAGIGAVSIYGGSTIDGFAGNATINQGQAAGNQAMNFGSVQVPVVPEPATWAMMLLGFAAIGYQMRKRRAPALMQLA